ncbi:matrixin family metalloprotease [Lujinxingia sediminis]|uniref:Matrixin family metalloprotease n=1 Tax=Lujinxingia sediminis TaxID=2480984 RepID=A0ABY0CSP4_9DELT|nr:matrixin family metalloprotease [Lujinxingia sediminis]RVU44138.1 matrixin family metalloprotease [Lujinxingia sediminis]
MMLPDTRHITLLGLLAAIALPSCTHEDAWDEEPMVEEEVPLSNDFRRTMTCEPDLGLPCDGYPKVPVEWPSLTVPYYINESGSPNLHPDDTTIPAALEADIVSAFDAWNAPECSEFLLDYRGTTAFQADYINGPPSQNVNVFVFRDESWPGQNGQAIALTTVTFSRLDGRILDADIEMNGADYVFSNAESGEAGTMDLRNTLTHEVGHFLGLDHAPNPDTTMYATAREGEIDKRDLHPGDIEGLCAIYPLGTPDVTPPSQPAQQGGICSLVAPDQPDHSALLAGALLALGMIWRRRRAGA